MANDDYNDRMLAVDPGTNVQLGVAARSRSSSCSDVMLTYVSFCLNTYSLVTIAQGDGMPKPFGPRRWFVVASALVLLNEVLVRG